MGNPFNMLNRLIISLGFADFDDDSQLRKAKDCVEILRKFLEESRTKNLLSPMYSHNNKLLNTEVIDLLQTTIKDDKLFNWNNFYENTNIYNYFDCLLNFLEELKNKLSELNLTGNYQNFTVQMGSEYKLKDLLQKSPPLPITMSNKLRINDEAETEIHFNQLDLKSAFVTTKAFRDSLTRVYGNIWSIDFGQQTFNKLKDLADTVEQNKLLNVKATNRFHTTKTDDALKFLIKEIWIQNINRDDALPDEYNSTMLIQLLAARVAIESNKLSDEKKQHLIAFMEKFISYYSNSFDGNEIESKNIVEEFIKSINDPNVTLNKEYFIQICHEHDDKSANNWWLIDKLEELGVTIPE